MFDHFTELYFLLDLVAFLAVICMHLVKTNKNLIRLYILQSFTVFVLLFGIGMAEDGAGLIFVAFLTLLIKVIVAPIFFARLIRRFGGRFTANNYLSTPLTLMVIMGLVMFSYSGVFLSLGVLIPGIPGLLALCLAIVLISIFLMINRRGAFSQMIGVLSLENGIILLASFIGIKQPLALEVGIIFDMVIWMIVAQVFIAMIYKQFGSLNITKMKRLIEE